MRRLLLPFLAGYLSLLLGFSPAIAGETALAHSLLKQQRYAEAAVLFQSPMWRGVAYYKAEQWDRALEAFAKSEHPMARYNIGNTYARMGHYALALESYLFATKKLPDFEDAKTNADLMRAFLRQESGNDSQQAAQPEARKIEDMPDEHSSTGKGEADSGDDESEKEKKPIPDSQEASLGSPKNKEGSDSDRPMQQDQQSTQALDNGSTDKNQEQQRAAKASTSNEKGSDSQEAGQQFLANEEERQQAIDQWLLKLEHDPSRFLKARIEQEKKRRSEAGTLAKPSESKW